MKSLQGQLLIASPQLIDPNFFRAVILIVQHDENGALGVVLNRPLDATIEDAWKQFSEKPCLREEILHLGGPCQGILMALHLDPARSQIEVIEGVHFATEPENIEGLMGQPEIQVKFFVGYAGWSPGQLDSELEEGSWLTTPATMEHIFSEDVDQWTKLRRDITRATLYASMNPKIIPIDPSMN